MYINDTHILAYFIIMIIGGLVGYFLNWCNYRLPDEKKVFCKEYFLERKKIKTNYFLIIATAILYVIILYKYGIHWEIQKDLSLLMYLALTPMLLSAFVIDYRLQIIPNRLNLTIFETGLVFAFLYGINSNLTVVINMLLGSIVGAGIFLIITLIGGLIAGKEAMGFGDVKLMGALGLYFGVANIIIISVMSFLLGAIISIILLATKKKKTDEYIPFGPFIVLATLIAIIVPSEMLLFVLFKIFTLGMYKE